MFGYEPDFYLGLLIAGITLGGVYALFGSGLTMIFGAAKLMNFAQGEIFMIGGYVAWLLIGAAGFAFGPALVVTTIALAVIGLLLATTLFRRITSDARSLEVGLVLTLGLSILLQNAALQVFGPNAYYPDNPWGTDGVSIGGVQIPYIRMLAFGLAVVILGALGLFLRYTRIGLAIRGVPQNRDLAVLVGIPERRVNVVSIVLGFALSGIAGAAVSPFYGVFPNMGAGFIFIGFAILYMGGMTSVLGSVVAALIVGVLTSFTSGLISASAAAITPLALIAAVLLFKPEGLFGSKVRTA
ncbi:branched-chain amino acid ABC transporter permease [Agromyces sp. SYSU T00194]|uniref:branched-chain amino acid ABC transporter permease n=1 Tax=Agromyces chitinivorans TaxID=3158560 RepID=UPI00339A7144